MTVSSGGRAGQQPRIARKRGRKLLPRKDLRVSGFPGLLGRGLIEARLPAGRPRSALSFPGLLGRGLIEARRGWFGRRGRRRFPGLLGRGLIEAGLLKGDRLPTDCPSPVYWAGASLKRGARNGGDRRAGRPSPVYWAGASLKQPPKTVPRVTPPTSPVYWAGASLKLVAPALVSWRAQFLPRSTGPGPH